MPLVPGKLKKNIEEIVFSALTREFGLENKMNDAASDYHRKLAKAIADIAIPIVKAIVEDAIVEPGQSITGGSPGGAVSGSTSSPGKIS